MPLYTLSAAALLTLSLRLWLAPPAPLPAPLLIAGLIVCLIAARRLPTLSLAIATCLAAAWLPIERADTCALPLTAPREATIPALIIQQAPQPTLTGWISAASLPGDPGSRLTLHLRAEDWPTPPLPGDTLTNAFGKLAAPPPPLLPEHAPRSALAIARGHIGSLSLAEPADILAPDQPTATLRLRRALARRHIALIDAIWALPLPEQHRALAIAMTLGSRAHLTDDATRPFRRTGTAHILAISGLHIGALLLSLLALTRRALCVAAPQLTAERGATRMAAPLVCAAVALYVAMLGAPLSALRSAIMALAALGAILVGRRPAPLLSLALAALLLCLLDPATPLDPAFWLSAGATGAILLAWQARPAALRGPERGAETRKRWWLRQLATSLYTSSAAWLGVAPIQLALSGELPISGLMLNPIVVPCVSILAFPLLAAGALLAPISPALAALPIQIGASLLIALGQLATWVADLPGATWTPGAPPWPVIGLMAAAALTALRGGSPRQRLLAIALTLALPAATARWDQPPADTLRVHFIPVGQGDATLVETPDGLRILIDAGGAPLGRDPGEHIVVPHLKRLGVSSLDAVILTHSDLDHMGGLRAVAHHIPTARFIYPADDHAPALGELVALMAARGAALEPARADRMIGQHARLLRPPGAHGNDSSLVLSLRHGGLHALLAGDLEAAGEGWLAGRGLGRADLLKMPHHGSRTSSTQRLLDATQPSVAVASAALHSRFGHPHPEVISRYRRAGALTLRTDLHGLIRADLTGRGQLRLYTQRPAGPIPLILPQITRHLWKTCHISGQPSAFTPD